MKHLSQEQRFKLVHALTDDLINSINEDVKFKYSFLEETLLMGRTGFIDYEDAELIEACEDAGLEDVLKEAGIEP